MKIRNGFVSNSSSSSFIIDQVYNYDGTEDIVECFNGPGNWEPLTTEDILDWLKQAIITYYKNQLKTAKRRITKDRWIKPGDTQKYIQKEKEWIKARLEYAQKHLDEELWLEPTLECTQCDIDYWYPGYVKDAYSRIIGDTSDNFYTRGSC